MGNCTNYGGMDEKKFEKFAPVVGVYVALASLACAVCIGLDLIRSFRWKKKWIAVKFFPLNAATLTILAVAIKIPSDTSEAMPGLFDQLAKRSGVVLVCISMNHMMPSLGSMNDRTILYNMIALAILVVTLFVNVLFQLITGVITKFSVAAAFDSVLMLYLFFILLSHALTVTTVNQHLAGKYKSKHEHIQNEIETYKINLTNKIIPVEKLRDYLNRYWLLALTSSPDYALRGSGMALVSAVICYAIVGISFIIYIVVRVYGEHSKCCYMRSSYEWSTGCVLGIQVGAIVLGVMSSYLRFTNSGPTAQFTAFDSLHEVEEYRIQKLKDWREAPLPFHVNSKWARNLAYSIKDRILLCCIWLQRLIVLSAKLVLLVIVRVGRLFKNLFLYCCCCCRCCCCCCCCRRRKKEEKKSNNTDIENTNLDSSSTSDCCGVKRKKDENNSISATSDLEVLQNYMLYVKDPLPSDHKKCTVARLVNQPRKWVNQSEEPATLREFLSDFSTPRHGFPSAVHDYGENVPQGASAGLTNCWSLTLVTLATIIQEAFGNSQQRESLQMIKEATDKVFKYAIIIDKNFLLEGTPKMITAAKLVWDKVGIFGDWVNGDNDNKKSSEDPVDIIDRMAKRTRNNEDPGDQKPLETIITNYQIGIANTIINTLVPRANAGSDPDIKNHLFDLLRKALADTMGACLVKLPDAILRHCCRGKVGSREANVREAAKILGETKDILQWLEQTLTDAEG